MKSRRNIFMIGVAAILFTVFGISQSYALEFEDWVGTWHQVNFQVKGVCEGNGRPVLFKNAGSAPGYIKIINYDSDEDFDAFVAIQLDGTWFSGNTNFELKLGNANDGVLKADEFEINYGEGHFDLYFYFRLTGKEKNGVLSSGKIASVAGIVEYYLFDGDGECNGGLFVNGKYVVEEKVPVAVKELQ